MLFVYARPRTYACIRFIFKSCHCGRLAPLLTDTIPALRRIFPRRDARRRTANFEPANEIHARNVLAILKPFRGFPSRCRCRRLAPILPPSEPQKCARSRERIALAFLPPSPPSSRFSSDGDVRRTSHAPG